MGAELDIDAGLDPDAGDLPDAGLPFVSAPIAAISMTPAAGDTATSFSADASASVDREDDAATLTYAWDWENDGAFDDTGVTAAHTFPAPGSYTVVLRVDDPGGLSGYAAFRVLVASPANLVAVTTAADESDANANPTTPGGTGLSLREAIEFANGTAGRQLVFVPAGTMTVIGSQLPGLDDAAGVDVVGDGAIVDGTVSTGSNCMLTQSDDNVVLGLEFRNCKGDAINIANGSSNNVVSRCRFRDNPTGVRVNNPGQVIGPDNVFDANTGDAVDLAGAANVVGNVIRNTGASAVFVSSSAPNSVIDGNLIVDGATAIEIDTGATGIAMRHNTIDGNGTGIDISPNNVTTLDFRNNSVTASSGRGLVAADPQFSANDNNLYSGNVGGDCSACNLGSNSVSDGPQFIDSLNGDYRLRPTSPAIDAAADTGIDANGPAPGTFSGTAPDIGFSEAP